MLALLAAAQIVAAALVFEGGLLFGAGDPIEGLLMFAAGSLLLGLTFALITTQESDDHETDETDRPDAA